MDISIDLSQKAPLPLTFTLTTVNMSGIPGKFSHLEGTIYDDFGEGYNDTHGSLTLGYALVFNHVGANEDKMVEKFNTGWVSMYFANGEGSTDGHYEAARDVAKGEQVFSYYGDDWFDYRTFDEISPAAVGDYYLKMADPFHGPTRVPGCPTTTLQVTTSFPLFSLFFDDMCLYQFLFFGLVC